MGCFNYTESMAKKYVAIGNKESEVLWDNLISELDQDAEDIDADNAKDIVDELCERFNDMEEKLKEFQKSVPDDLYNMEDIRAGRDFLLGGSHSIKLGIVANNLQDRAILEKFIERIKGR